MTQDLIVTLIAMGIVAGFCGEMVASPRPAAIHVRVRANRIPPGILNAPNLQ